MGKQEKDAAAPNGVTAGTGVEIPRRDPRFVRTSLPLPGRMLGAMDRQSGLTMQASQSFPQQLVQLVGHRHKGDAAGVLPRTKPAQMGCFEPEAPIG